MSDRAIDLNADLGEGFPNDVALLGLVTSASISCGRHAGDPRTIVPALREAKRRGVIVGAHPSYLDRDKFGRREMWLPPGEIARWIVVQFEFLNLLATHSGVDIRFVKPHGALYNQAQREDEVARAVIMAMGRLKLPILGQPGTFLEARAGAAEVPYITEGFPDRRYGADGLLFPRSKRDAVLRDPNEIEAQVVRLVDQGVMTLCIHGDDPRAVANAETVRAILDRQGITLRSFLNP